MRAGSAPASCHTRRRGAGSRENSSSTGRSSAYESVSASTVDGAKARFSTAPLVKKLKGKGVGQWRLQVGAYQIRYDVVHRDVVLYRVRHRKEIYRD